MPIYEYRCEKCGVFEETQRITDPPLERCPTCRRKVRRLISNTSFQLKGGGWYVTDYARAAKPGQKAAEKASGGSDGKDAGASGASESSPSESKTEGKTKAESKGESKSDSKTASADA